MEYLCKKCKAPIDDLAEAMIEGCPCGSRGFIKSKMKKTSVGNDDKPVIQKKPTGDVAIAIKQKGEYQLNLLALVKRESERDPIFVEDSKGIINVVLNPEPEE